MKHVAIFIIKIYKKLFSPFLPASCRFYPTCSDYSVQAFERFGFIKGLRLSVSRIFRCNPFNAGGLDPVPGHQSSNIKLQTCKEHNHGK